MGYVGGKLKTLCDVDPIQRAAKNVANAGVDELKARIEENTPIDTGRLRESWKRSRSVTTIRVPTIEGIMAYKGRVYTNVDYAPYVEYGTGLWGPEHRKYEITPKKPDGVLTWIQGGRRVFAKRVWHPGSPPQHMTASGAAKVEVTIGSAAAPALEVWKHEQEAKADEAMAGVVIPS